jgi:hypothetical protein
MSLFGPQWRLAICKQEKYIGLGGHQTQIPKHLVPNVVTMSPELCRHIAHIENRTRVSVRSVFNTLPLLLSYFCTILYIATTQSVLRHVHSLFQIEFFTEWDLVLPVSIYSILSFSYSHPVVAYVFFVVFSHLSLLCVLICLTMPSVT